MISDVLPVGKLLHNGKYRIEKILGQGGFGITYLASETSVDRKVAIKEFFPKDYCGRDSSTSHVSLGTAGSHDLVVRLRDKFLKEARNLSKLNHQNIVRVYSAFEENGTAYYVMDYIEGLSLEDIVDRYGPRSERQALEYIRPLGEALQFVHDNNMMHLDIKPANVMLRIADDRVVLIDFGLSKQYDKGGRQTSTTPVGISHGFAPMEQYAAGGVGTFSPQTDVYSLGATLYYLLTGEVPPDAMQLLEEGIDLPDFVSPYVAEAIKKAMMVVKTNRQQSVNEFLADLRLLNANSSSSFGSATQIKATGRLGNATQLKSDRFPSEPARSSANAGKALNPQQTLFNGSATQSVSRNDEELSAGKNKSVKVILWIVLACLCIAAGVVFFLLNKNSNNRAADYDSDDIESVSLAGGNEGVTSREDVSQYSQDSDIEMNSSSDVRSYFRAVANHYGNYSGIVYDGAFTQNGQSWPIKLFFDIDGNGNPVNCVYKNVQYGTKVNMSVSFEDNQMFLEGNAGGSYFRMMFDPGSDGYWSGWAKNGNNLLEASIYPETMSK